MPESSDSEGLEVHLRLGEVDSFDIEGRTVEVGCGVASHPDGAESRWSAVVHVEPGGRRTFGVGQAKLVVYGHGPRPEVERTGLWPIVPPYVIAVLGVAALAAAWWAIWTTLGLNAPAEARLWGAVLAGLLLVVSAALWLKAALISRKVRNLRRERAYCYAEHRKSASDSEERRKWGGRLMDLDSEFDEGEVAAATTSGYAAVGAVLVAMAALVLVPSAAAVGSSLDLDDGEDPPGTGERDVHDEDGTGEQAQCAPEASEPNGPCPEGRADAPCVVCEGGVQRSVDVQLLGGVEGVLGLLNTAAGSAVTTKAHAEEVLRGLADQVGIPLLKRIVDRAADEALDWAFRDDTTSGEETDWQIQFALILQELVVAEPSLNELSAQVNITMPTEVVVELGEDSVQELAAALLLVRPFEADIEELASLVAEVLAESGRQSGPPVLGVGENAVIVRPGDSLWRIAEAALGGQPTAREVDEYWRRIYRDNRQVIGLDPDSIYPDMRLNLPR
jgi:hypothetical protein